MRSIFVAATCLLGAAGLAGLTLPVLAQGQMQVPGAKDPKRVKAGTYQVDSAHTQIMWRVNHLGFNDYFGLFGSATGTLTIDPAKPAAASVAIEVPIKSAVTSHEGLTTHLLGADFFDAEKFPTASFKSTSVRLDDDGDEAEVTGTLTIKGVSKTVVLEVDFVGAGASPPQAGGKDTIGFHAETKIRRSDFGISYGIPFVPDEVPLKISVAFERQ